jgi:hypothetical protein
VTRSEGWTPRELTLSFHGLCVARHSVAPALPPPIPPYRSEAGLGAWTSPYFALASALIPIRFLKPISFLFSSFRPSSLRDPPLHQRGSTSPAPTLSQLFNYFIENSGTVLISIVTSNGQARKPNEGFGRGCPIITYLGLYIALGLHSLFNLLIP